MASVGQKIRNRRIELGMSVEDLAKRIGKNRATVYRYESDYIENLPLTIIVPLAEALHCSPGFLMGWEEQASWSAQFLNTLSSIIGESDAKELKLLGLDPDYLRSVIDGDVELTFERACDIVDALGESFDFMLGRNADNTVKSALKAENGLDKEILTLLTTLSDEKKRQAVDYLRFLAESSKKQ